VSKKVVIGLSGGLDSTMAAFILKEQGYDVSGLHFSFTDEKYPDEIADLSDKLNIPVDTIYIKDDFEIVKQHFAQEYLKGRTPSPCTFCNRVIKWKKLLDYADQNQCDYIATGHYIRKEQQNGYHYLKKGVDPIKDQSYFLWELDSNVIKRMLNPLGDLTKDQVRELAIKHGFTNLARKKESMGVCFLHQTDYREFLKNYIPDEIKKIPKGVVVDQNGKQIGIHNGYIHYTIGQKRDLHLMDNRKVYVTNIDATQNVITVHTKESLNHHHILIRNIQILNPHDIEKGTELQVNIRGYGLNPENPVVVLEKQSDHILLKLTSPAWAVAPGQPVVFYRNDLVLGGGIAEKSW